LGQDFLEKVYENALAHKIRKSGLDVKQQYSIQVYYDEQLVGDYIADLFVEDCVLIELKAIKSIDEVHMAQCMNYLKATGLKACLLLNFGKPKIQIKRIVNNL
jgi:GxxExxY protein